MLTGRCSHFICGLQILKHSAYCCWRPWATCNQMHVPRTAPLYGKIRLFEPILLSCLQQSVPSHVFASFHYLHFSIASTTAANKGGLQRWHHAQEPGLTANGISPSPDYLSSLQLLHQLHWPCGDLHQLKNTYTHTPFLSVSELLVPLGSFSLQNVCAWNSSLKVEQGASNTFTSWQQTQLL